MSSLRNFLSFARTYAGPKELIGRFGELLLGYMIYPFAYLFPRNSNKWLFGTNVGFTDNAKYLYLYTLEQQEVHAIWITNKPNVLHEMRELHLEVYAKWSLKGLWHCLTAGRYIFTSHSNDINFFTVGRAKKVNLWHGIGIKGVASGKKGKKRDEALHSLAYKIAAPHNYEHFDLFLSTGPLMNSHFCRMYNLPNEIIFEGSYPRCNFIQKPIDAVDNHIARFESKKTRSLVEVLKRYQKVILYMPTWRANFKDDFIAQAGIDFVALNKVMKQLGAIFLVKLHPAVRHFKIHDNLDAVLFVQPCIDVYSILPFTHILVTDYSSIYYDYLLMPEKNVLLFPFDYQSYIESSKSLAFDYDEYTPGVRVYSFAQLLEILSSGRDLSFPNKEKIVKLFWGEDFAKKANNIFLFDRIKQL